MSKINAYFSREEFSCQCGCGFDSVDAELLQVLTKIREHFNAPIEITSGNRCAARNKAIGGEEKSCHIRGMAADFKVKGISAQIVQEFLENVYKDKYGIGRYPNRTHVDVRETPARWTRNV
jgi:uncharacterized protein YcbK (DUF882 family)